MLYMKHLVHAQSHFELTKRSGSCNGTWKAQQASSGGSSTQKRSDRTGVSKYVFVDIAWVVEGWPSLYLRWLICLSIICSIDCWVLVCDHVMDSLMNPLLEWSVGSVWMLPILSVCAGVGIGMLRGGRDSLNRKWNKLFQLFKFLYLKITKLSIHDCWKRLIPCYQLPIFTLDSYQSRMKYFQACPFRVY